MPDYVQLVDLASSRKGRKTITKPSTKFAEKLHSKSEVLFKL